MDNIFVNASTQLSVTPLNDGTFKVAEIYANFETGNYFSAPSTANEEELVLLYNKLF